MRAKWLLVLVCAAACADDVELETGDVEATDDGKADAAELRVRASDTTLWVDRFLERRGDAFVLSGRTSRNITDGNAFIFDDVFGAFEQRSPRTYEVTWQTSELRGVADGVNLFTSMTFVHSNSRPDHMTARVIVRPRLSAIAGSGSLSLTAELTPVIVAGRTVYRIKGRSTKTINALTVSTGTGRLVDPTHFEVDLTFDQLLAATAPGAKVSVTAQLPTSTTTIRGGLGLAVKRLGLTSGDVEQVFPSPTCTTELLTCLDALPDGALDLASCGPALEVSRCRGQIGVIVDQAMVDATLAAADTRMTSFATDGRALVGADRSTALATAVREQVTAAVETERGVWLLSETSRATILSAAVERPLDAAYARPLALVGGPHAVMPGDLATTRQVAADALLVHLAAQDFAATEFGRSYDELTKVFRDRHLASLRAFRETAPVETIGGKTFLIDRWLDAHTELEIDVAAGTVQSILVEID